jgi:WD40 repeat protein
MPELAFSLPTPAEPTMFALSGSGRTVGAACADEKLRIWSLPERRLLHTLELGTREIDITAMSADGRWIVTGDHKGAVTIWNSATGGAHMRMRISPYPWPALFSRDSKTLAIASMGGAIQVFDVATGRKRFELAHSVGGTNGLSFSRDDTRIAAVDQDCVLRIYDASTGTLVSRNDDSLMEPLAVDFTPDGGQVVIGGGDKVTAYIDAATGKVMRRLDRDAEPPLFLRFSADGRYLAIQFFKAANMLAAAPLIVLDAATSRKSVDWMPPGALLGMSWTDDGSLFAAISASNALRVWRVLPA